MKTKPWAFALPIAIWSLFFVFLTVHVRADDDRQAVFSQLAVGGGFAYDFFVANQGYGMAEDVELHFFGDNGAPLVVSIGTLSGSVAIFDLGPGQTQVFTVVRDGDITAGYAVLTSPNNSSIRATGVIRYADNGTTVTTVGVSQQFPRTSYTFGGEIDTSRGIRTGVAIANGRFPRSGVPDPTAQGFVISLINPNGTIRDSTVLNLGEGEHIARFLNENELFPGLDNFKGTVSVSAGVPFGLVALGLDQAILSSVSIDPGPMFSALDFSGGLGAAVEVEPNDSAGEAQLLALPAKIRGERTNGTGDDLFRISAQAGQVLTAFALALANSQLDAYLTVEEPDGTLVSQNDDSGLLGTADSFIQMVIPADGTYVIRVSDFFDRAGPDFDYELCVDLSFP
jgi:hypothetical protein